MFRVAALCLLAASFATASLVSYDTEVKKPSHQTLISFTWSEDSDEKLWLSVCFSWNETAEPTEKFELTYSNGSGPEVTVMSEDVPLQSEGVACGDVYVELETLSFSTEEAYIVNSEELFAAANFRMSIEPKTLRAESLIVANITRVTGLANYSLEGCDVEVGASCFWFDNSDPEELCNFNNNIYVCDTTFEIEVVESRTEGTEAVLMYDDVYTVEVSVAAASSELEVLISNADGNFDLCNESSCNASQSPGNFTYTILVVEIDPNSDEATSSDKVSFQDLNLSVVDTEPVVDFSLENKYGDRTYKLYSNTSKNTIFDSIPITLDCTQIPEDIPCYAFVESGTDFLGVKYNDDTNGIIMKIK